VVKSLPLTMRSWVQLGLTCRRKRGRMESGARLRPEAVTAAARPMPDLAVFNNTIPC
jgi:hypothetical protein